LKAVTARKPISHTADAAKYCRDVVSGRVLACRWVKLACKRHLSDLQKSKEKAFPFKFDQAKADRACKFVELMPHIKGPKAGTSITLEPWQKFILCSVFGWVEKLTGLRRFRKAYVEVPRGNAKSTLSSGIALYMLACDGESGGEVYSAATTRDQAKIVFGVAQEMAKRLPQYRERWNVEVTAHAVTQSTTASKFVPLAADANNLDGLNIHCGIIDELHAHPTRLVYDVLETGIGKRSQPLLWCITTAGFDLSGICYEVRTLATKALDGSVPNDGMFAVIYSIDEDDDWSSDEALVKANPNWTASIDHKTVQQMRNEALAMPSKQSNYKTKHLCVWCSASSPWMSMEAWDRCKDASLTLDAVKHLPCIIPLDLASKIDMAAAPLMFWDDSGEKRKVYLFGRYYLPQAAIEDGRNSQYRGWAISGKLTVTDGEVIDFGRIKEDIEADLSRFDVQSVPYDPWQATQLATELQTAGAPVLEFRNTVANMSEPMKELDAMVRDGRLVHDGCPIMKWMASNVVAKLDNKDNIFPRKERPENKIDGIVAAIMGMGAMMQCEPISNAKVEVW
jgi:phage terminase large subunit-like protein